MEKRNTVQKEMVYNAVNKLDCHPTADEVYETVCKDCPSVSRGTVYRNLNVLSDENKILKVKVPDGADRFDRTCHKHYHCRCDICGKVFDINTDEMPDIMSKVKNSEDITVTDFQIMFSGVCAGCREK